MEMECQNCTVSNDLNLWPSEKLEIGGAEIECPNCGAIHDMFRGKFSGELYVNLRPDNG